MIISLRDNGKHLGSIDATAYDSYFGLLRAGLYGSIPTSQYTAGSCDWEAILTMSKKQTTTALVSDAISRLPVKARPPEEICRRFNKYAMSVVKSHIVVDSVLAQISRFYNDNGIRTILLKGQGVAQYYREPMLRQCGDIDLYVGDANYQKAIDLAKETLLIDWADAKETYKHFSFSYRGVTIELHRLADRLDSPFKRKAYQQWLHSELESEDRLRLMPVNGVDVYRPSVELDAVFIFHHIWHHLINQGIGCRQICDLAMVLYRHGKDIDRQWLRKSLVRFGLMRQWQIMGYILVWKFGLSADNVPLYDAKVEDKAKKVLRLILDGGNFGAYTPTAINHHKTGSFIKRKAISLRNVFSHQMSLFSLSPVELASSLTGYVMRGSKTAARQMIAKAKHRR